MRLFEKGDTILTFDGWQGWVRMRLAVDILFKIFTKNLKNIKGFGPKDTCDDNLALVLDSLFGFGAVARLSTWRIESY